MPKNSDTLIDEGILKIKFSLLSEFTVHINYKSFLCVENGQTFYEIQLIGFDIQENGTSVKMCFRKAVRQLLLTVSDMVPRIDNLDVVNNYFESSSHYTVDAVEQIQIIVYFCDCIYENYKSACEPEFYSVKKAIDYLTNNLISSCECSTRPNRPDNKSINFNLLGDVNS